MKTLCLLVASLVLFKQSYALSLSRRQRSSGNPRKISFSLPEDKLVNLQVNVNKDFGSTGQVVFEKNDFGGRVVQLSADNLNFKKGDVILYDGVFVNDDRSFGEEGNDVFDGAFKKPTRHKRETTDEPLQNPDIKPIELIESRFGGNKRWMGPPGDRFRSPGYHFDNHGPPHFDHHRDPPPFHHRPGPWGHGPTNKFGHHGPWDGHDDEEDFYDGHFDKRTSWHQKFDDRNNDFNKEKHDGRVEKPNGVKRPEAPVDKPNGVERSYGAVDKPKGVVDKPKGVVDKPKGVVDKPVYEVPDRIDDTSPGNWGVSSEVDGSSSAGKNQGSNSLDQGSRNGVKPVISNKVTTTSTVVPQIDIRFSAVDD